MVPSSVRPTPHQGFNNSSTRVAKLTPLLSVTADASNQGNFTWTIGQSDNVNNDLVTKDANYVLVLNDPSGQTGTGNGWVNNQLQSRAFKLNPIVISSSTSSSSSTTSTSSSSTSMTVPTSTTSTPSSTASSSSDLSPGAKAGIGVGAALGAIALIALAVGATLYCVRRKRRNAATEVDARPAMAQDPSYHDDPHKQYSYAQTYEAPVPPSELVGSEVRSEFPSGNGQSPK